MVSNPVPARTVRGSAWRFLIVGGVNTVVTTLILVGLSYVVVGWLAFTIAFGLGLIYSVLFASRWVFSRSGSARASAIYAASYVVIYLIGLATIAFIQQFDGPQYLNGLSVLVTAPLGFLTGRIVFAEKGRSSE